MRNDIIPYARIDQICNFIKDVSSEKPSIEEINERFGRSVFYNLLPSLQLLKLVRYDKEHKTIELTDLGKNFRSALITDDKKRAAEILRNPVDSAPVFSFVKAFLERRKSINILDIGRELAFKFNKKWDNVLTYKTYGAASASILGFVGYGIYSRGVLRKNGIKVEKSKITPPHVGFDKILRITDIVSTYGEIDMHSLSDKLKTKESRLWSEIKNCIDLGLLQRPAPGKIVITRMGNELVNPLNKNRRSEVFGDALLSSGFSEIIGSLPQEFTIDGLGRILKHKLGGKWLEDMTIKTHGKKFYSWLNSAGLAKKIGKGKYIFISETIEKIQKPEKVRFLSSTDYYDLGKSVGILLSPKNEFEKVKKAAEKLIELCKQEENLLMAADLLEEHYKLFLDLKESRIFNADIKIMERALGIKEWNSKSPP